jgi:hypothetical protein
MIAAIAAVEGGATLIAEYDAGLPKPAMGISLDA